jgi:CheY-like chemotaxis protein
LNSRQSILVVVDDDLYVLEVIEARLSSSGFQVCKASGVREALGILRDKKVDLIISDMKMPGMGAMSFNFIFPLIIFLESLSKFFA